MVLKILFWNILIPINFYINYLILTFFSPKLLLYKTNLLNFLGILFLLSLFYTLIRLFGQKIIFEWKLQFFGGTFADLPTKGSKITQLIHKLSRQASIFPLPQIKVYDLASNKNCDEGDKIVALLDLKSGPTIYLAAPYLNNLIDELELKNHLAQVIAEIGQGQTFHNDIIKSALWIKDLFTGILLWPFAQFVYQKPLDVGPLVKRESERNLRNLRLSKIKNILNQIFDWLFIPIFTLLAKWYFKEKAELSLKLKDHLLSKLESLERVS